MGNGNKLSIRNDRDPRKNPPKRILLNISGNNQQHLQDHGHFKVLLTDKYNVCEMLRPILLSSSWNSANKLQESLYRVRNREQNQIILGHVYISGSVPIGKQCYRCAIYTKRFLIALKILKWEPALSLTQIEQHI